MSNKDRYTQTFVLPDGSETKVIDSYMGRYIAVPIQRIYQKPEHQNDNKYMDKKWRKLDCKKIEVSKLFINEDTMEQKPVVDTVVLAENKDWNEYSLAPSYTGEHARNCKYITKVEVILMDEEYSRRLFFSWKGNLSVFDFMKDCPERILEDIIEEPEKHHAYVEDKDSPSPIIYLDFYSNNGETAEIELEGERDIEKRIASVRVVEFTEKIID